MKPIHCLVLILSLLSACTAAPAATELAAPSPASVTETSTATLAQSAAQDGNAGALFGPGLVQSQQEYSQIPGATLYKLAMEIDTGLENVTGRAEIRYTNRGTAALDKVELRLFPNILGGKMGINSLMVNGQASTPAYGLQNSLLIVPLNKALQPGETSVIGIDFVVSVPDDPTQNYGVLAHNSAVLTLAHAYPMVAVYAENGWHAEIPPQSGDLTFTDAAYYTVQVTAPADLTLVATGREISRQQTAQTQTVNFALGPAHDFMLAAVSGYDKVRRQVGEVTINSYAPAAELARAALALDTAAEAVKIYSQRYAPYPYTELDVVATPTLALGGEYPGLVVITDRLYASGEIFNGAPIENYLEGTVAHEVGHQWFYNLVGNDQLNQPWLDESLAQFVTWQYYAERYGAGAAEEYKQSFDERWARVRDEKIPVGQPVAAYNGKEYSAIVYGRGALFFLALRKQIGQEKFDAFLRAYTTHYTWGIATSDGLQAQAEQACACDLTGLFKDWIYP
jgi:hypothetical protein